MTRVAQVVAAPAAGAVAGGSFIGGATSPQRVVVSIGLILENAGGRQIVWGECLDDDPAYPVEEAIALIRQVAAPALIGREITGFRELVGELDSLIEAAAAASPANGKGGGISRREVLRSPFGMLRGLLEEIAPEAALAELPPVKRSHAAVRYGVSQALIQAAALARSIPMAHVMAEEWSLPLPNTAIPIHAQGGDDLDRLIACRAASLGGGAASQDGSGLTQDVRRLKARIGELGGADYRPTIHLEAQGALGRMADHAPGRVLGHLYALEQAAKPYALWVEDPVVLDNRDAQIQAMSTLRDYIRARRMAVQIAAGNWIDSVDAVRRFIEGGAADAIVIRMAALGGIHHALDAVLACKAAGIAVLLDGGHTDTDLSTQVAVHAALAARPDAVMARTSDELLLIQNEMTCTLAWIGAR